MANYITCKDTRSFAYAETTNKGYYEVVSVNEDGSSCHVKTVWHENKNYIGREYDISTERAAEDFIAVDEITVIGVLERQMLAQTGWNVERSTSFNRQSTILDNIEGYMYTNCNVWSSRYYRETREFLYIPNEDSVGMPRTRTYCGCFSRDDARQAARTARDILRANDYEYAEAIIVMPYDNFDTIVEETIAQVGEEYTVVEFPAELKLQLRSMEHKVVVLRKDNHFVYLTNIRADHIIFSSVIFFADQIGKPLDEEAKAALLARNQEAYRISIYKNIDTVINGMAERARLKMFDDFGGEFTGIVVQPLRTAVDHARRDYENYERYLRESFERLQDANAKLFYAEHGIENGENEFIAFLKDAKDSIVSIKADPRSAQIIFCVRTFLTYWDDDLWDIIRKSDNSFRNLDNWQKIMLDAIFKDRTVKLLFEQKFCLYTNSCEPSRYDDYNSDVGEGSQGMYNPHIKEFNCWGTHKLHIRDAMRRADYIQAYGQAVACISGVTLSDSPVMGRFFNYFTSSRNQSKPCLYVNELGKYVTMKEYKELVKGKKWEA